MQRLHLVGFTSELDGLIFSARRGSRSGGFVVTLDEQLLASIREAIRLQSGDDVDLFSVGDDGQPRRRQARIESGLAPKEIQARLRAGRTVEEVAEEADVDEEWIRRFASPVLAEQAQVVTRALSVPVRANRKGESAEPLATAVALNLADRGQSVTDDELARGWGAHHVRDSSWVVRYRYRSRRGDQTAQWEFDLADGSLVPLNRLATELGWVEAGRRRKRTPLLEVAATDERRSSASAPESGPQGESRHVGGSPLGRPTQSTTSSRAASRRRGTTTKTPSKRRAAPSAGRAGGAAAATHATGRRSSLSTTKRPATKAATSRRAATSAKRRAGGTSAGGRAGQRTAAKAPAKAPAQRTARDAAAGGRTGARPAVAKASASSRVGRATGPAGAGKVTRATTAVKATRATAKVPKAAKPKAAKPKAVKPKVATAVKFAQPRVAKVPEAAKPMVAGIPKPEAARAAKPKVAKAVEAAAKAAKLPNATRTPANGRRLAPSARSRSGAPVATWANSLDGAAQATAEDVVTPPPDIAAHDATPLGSTGGSRTRRRAVANLTPPNAGSDVAAGGLPRVRVPLPGGGAVPRPPAPPPLVAAAPLAPVPVAAVPVAAAPVAAAPVAAAPVAAARTPVEPAPTPVPVAPSAGHTSVPGASAPEPAGQNGLPAADPARRRRPLVAATRGGRAVPSLDSRIRRAQPAPTAQPVPPDGAPAVNLDPVAPSSPIVHQADAGRDEAPNEDRTSHGVVIQAARAGHAPVDPQST